MAAAPRDLPGLYVHVPFCSAICPYCDFAALRGGAALRARFTERLATELPLAARAWPERRPFDTVYFGGGTPSLLPPEHLARLLDDCRRHLALAAPAPWVFLEANPEDVTAEACAAWRRLGVRTLSLGVQSFSDDALRFLGRRHTAAQARAAVETARAAGFDTVSIDLVFGLPGQSAAAWRRELATATALGPEHISCYQLTVHPRTVFGVRAAQGRLTELGESEQAGLFVLTHHLLAETGWEAYEVSSFARGPAHRSHHNLKYWNHLPYLGIGPSAHSFARGDRGARRWWNVRHLRAWEQRLAAGLRPVEGEETIGPAALAAETLLLGLRTTAGIDLDAFSARFGIDLLSANEALVASLVRAGRVRVLDGPRGRRLVPTVAGLAVADGLAAALARPI